MFAQINKSILILAIGVLAVDASAIKGHSSRPNEEAARSIKLASASNTIDKSPSPVVQAPPAPVQQAPKPISTVPILESSKKVYNDESIRRYSSVTVQQQPIQPVIEQAPAAVKSASVAEPAVAPVPVPVAVPVAPVVVPVVAQQQPPVVAVAAPAAVAAPVDKVQQAPVQPVVVSAPVVQKDKEQAPIEPAKVAAPAVVEAKSAAPEKQQSAAPEKQPVKAVDQAQPFPAAAPQDPLPPQSVRSAVIKEEKPVEEKAQKEVAPIVVQSPPAAEEIPQPSAKVAESQPAPVAESTLEAKKSYVSTGSDNAASGEQPLNIEVPAPDPGLVLSEPIDSTTKLLIDLDEHVQTFLPADQQHQPSAPKDQNLTAGVDYSPPSGKSSAPLVPYSSSANNDESIVPPMPSLDGVEKASANAPAAGAPAATPSGVSPSTGASPSATRQGQVQNQQQVITQLLDQLDSLQNRIQDTINQLVARRRYVMSALLRPMGTYVRRVRTNLERLQNRVNQLQAAASSVGGPNNQNRPGGFVDAAAIETIRRRIDDISKRISDIVNRIRFSLTPTSAPMNNNGR